MDIDLQRCFFELRAGREATLFIRSLEDEIARLRLTDAERSAVMWAIGACEIEQTTASIAADRGYLLPETREWAAKHGERAATLRGLLERSGVTEPMLKEKRA